MADDGASGLSLTDALFENVSAVTTTGLTTTATVLDKPDTFLFARAWLQWVGGLGIVVLSLAVTIQPGLAAKRIGGMEGFEEDLVGSTRAHARRIFRVYAVLTAIGILLLGLIAGNWFHAVLYALAAVSTGGFAPHDASLEGLSGGWAQAAVILLCMAGAVPLALYHRTFKKGWTTIWRDCQVRGLVATGLSATLALAALLHLAGALPWPQALRRGALTALSAQSTAGFASLDISQLDPGSKVVLILVMFVGGGLGSTAGGVKIARMLILGRVLHLLIQRAGMPRQAVAEADLGGRKLVAEEIQNALTLMLVFVVCIALSWLPFVAMGHAPLDALFEVVSAMGTVGLSTGVASPDLHPALKGVLCADMLLGRLEILAWLVLVYPGNWLGRRLEE
jgi:trk system potassium uptake protein TrkH